MKITDEMNSYLNQWGRKEKIRLFHMKVDIPCKLPAGEMKYKTYSNLEKYKPELYRDDRILRLWNELKRWCEYHPELKHTYSTSYENHVPVQNSIKFFINYNNFIILERNELKEIKLRYFSKNKNPNKWIDWCQGSKHITIVKNPKFAWKSSNEIYLSRENVNSLICNDIIGMINTINDFIETYFPNKKWYKPLHGMKI